MEKDAETLAAMVAARKYCNIEPIYRGFDGVAGRYDFNVVERQEFADKYEYHLFEKQEALS